MKAPSQEIYGKSTQLNITSTWKVHSVAKDEGIGIIFNA